MRSVQDDSGVANPPRMRPIGARSVDEGRTEASVGQAETKEVVFEEGIVLSGLESSVVVFDPMIPEGV